MPFQMTVRVYNAAGEQVSLLYSGHISAMPGAPGLSSGVLQPGVAGGGISLGFAGTLDNGQSTLAWNGNSDSGTPVRGGTYTIHIETSDQFGNVSSYNVEVAALQPRGVNGVRIFNSAGEMVYSEEFHSLSVTVTDIELTDSSFAPSFDAAGNPVGKISGSLRDASGNVAPWSWDGRNSEGHLVSPGLYTIQLVSDAPGAAGNPSLRQVQVLRAPDGLDALPKAVVSATQLSLRFNPAAVLGGISATLYNVAGERIGTVGASAAGGEILLNISGLSSGVYVAILNYESPGHEMKRNVVKFAIVH
jgi:hypothetical protein